MMLYEKRLDLKLYNKASMTVSLFFRLPSCGAQYIKTAIYQRQCRTCFKGCVSQLPKASKLWDSWQKHDITIGYNSTNFKLSLTFGDKGNFSILAHIQSSLTLRSWRLTLMTHDVCSVSGCDSFWSRTSRSSSFCSSLSTLAIRTRTPLKSVSAARSRSMNRSLCGLLSCRSVDAQSDDPVRYMLQ